MRVTALIADDEAAMREQLHARLLEVWPEIEVVALAANGVEAVELAARHQPQIAFLDIRMPGMGGIEAARQLYNRCHIVFATAYDQYAVDAFEHGAIDYLVKPFEEERLAETVKRLQARQAGAAPRADEAVAPLLDRLAAELRKQAPARTHLQWIRASVGNAVRLIPVDEVVYLRSDEKYTLVAWAGGEALIRKTIRELADELDESCFVQVHRSVIVNLRHVAQVVRGANETADVHLRGRSEVLPVSRSYLHLFKQM